MQWAMEFCLEAVLKETLRDAGTLARYVQYCRVLRYEPYSKRIGVHKSSVTRDCFRARS